MGSLSHVNAQGEAHMVDVGAKPPLRRIAIATGDILLKPDTLALIRENGLKKGDVLGVARIAGIQAAKLTPTLVPLCHTLSLDAVDVSFEIKPDRVTATARTECVGKTGVEMEAISAVSVALVTIYDMCKAVDKEMVLTGIRLLEKQKLSFPAVESPANAQAGLTQKHHGNLRISIITLSDRASSGVYEDLSGPAIEAALMAHPISGRWSLAVDRKLIPDDADHFRLELSRAKESGADVVLTTGGTGVGTRDMAPDVVASFLEKELPGIMESIRTKYGQDKPMARLSRGVAGVSGTCQFYTLPGSVKAVNEYMSEILKTLEHIVFLVRGVDPHA